MIQWTSPTDELRVRGVDLTGCDVWVSYQQRKVELDVKATTVAFDGSDTTVTVELAQAQTAMFKPGTVQVQVNWVTLEGRRDATLAKEDEVHVNLLEHEVAYGD